MTRRAKYANQKTTVDGILFDSKKEATRYTELKLLQRAKQIRGLIMQPRFPLECGQTPIKIRSEGFPNGRQSTYIADFQYYDIQAKQRVVEDVKGMDTPTSRLKRAIVEAQYGILITII